MPAPRNRQFFAPAKQTLDEKRRKFSLFFLSASASTSGPAPPLVIHVNGPVEGEEEENQNLMILYRPWKNRFLEETKKILKPEQPHAHLAVRCKEYKRRLHNLTKCRLRTGLPQQLDRASYSTVRP